MKKIDIIIDFVCPYCFVAVEEMIKYLGDRVHDLEFNFLPYELRPEPNPQALADETRRQYIEKNILPWAKEVGVGIRIPTLSPIPRTALAFEALLFAKDVGKQLDLARGIMEAYWQKDRDISNIDVLAEIGQEVGFDKHEMLDALRSGKYREEHKLQNEEVSEWDFEVVPTFYVDGTMIPKFPKYADDWENLF